MKFLVTGGSGFIGSHLCDELIKRNYEVICLDNLVTGVKSNIEHLLDNKNFSFYQEDACEGTRFNVNGIFHLASPTAPDESTYYANETVEVNSGTTKKLLGTGKKFLFASSMKVYGECDRMVAYIKGKKEGERLCEGSRAKIARLASVYGPRMKQTDSRVVPVFVSRALKNQPLSVWNGGEQTDSFCYVSDIVRGLCDFMIMSYTGVIEFGNPVGIKIIDLAKLILKLTNSNSDLITTEQKLVVEVCHLMPNISNASTLFGWFPRVKIEDGLLKVIESYRTNN